ncbi:MAG: hypothetical protein JWQ09_4147 [Segetibacter sp.]|nr:hypothetical protein [Segetibacter sp.]
MTFDYPGYILKFIQKQKCKDNSAHLFTLIYKFYSPVTRYFYVLRAEYHEGEVFTIKFYCKKDRHSDFKYSKIINKGDVGNILITCAHIVPILLKGYPLASFCFIGSRTIDMKSGKVEPVQNNQRFRTYKYLIASKFGTHTFAHFAYDAISSYLLVNRKNIDVEIKERELVRMFSETYLNLPDIII